MGWAFVQSPHPFPWQRRRVEGTLRGGGGAGVSSNDRNVAQFARTHAAKLKIGLEGDFDPSVEYERNTLRNHSRIVESTLRSCQRCGRDICNTIQIPNPQPDLRNLLRVMNLP